MGAYDSTIGALVLTSWFNSALFTVEGLQIYSYFSRFRNDTMLNKTFVSIALVSDIMGVIASLASVYLYAVTHFGDAVFAQTQPWTFPAYVTSSGVSGAVTQSFLALRIFRLTHNWFYVVLFFLLIAASFGGAMGLVISVATITSLEERVKLQTYVRVWTTCAAAVDILIALALVTILARTKTDFKETGNIIRRLMYASVKTGSLTAGFAILALVLYSARPNDNISVFFSLSLGRLYSISMLSNLHARRANDGTDRGPSSGGEASTEHKSGSRSRAGASRTKGIKITSETVTRIDDGNGNRDMEDGPDVIQLSERRTEEKSYMSPINESGMTTVSYEGSNHQDKWDAESLDHSQVDLVNRHK